MSNSVANGTAPDEALSEALLASVAQHYVPLRRAVALDVHIVDAPQLSRRFVLGESLQMQRLDAAAPTQAAAARLSLRAELLQAMLADPAGFDERSAQAQALGGLRVEGAADIASYWLQLLKRPSEDARAALARALQRAPATLDTVRELHAGACSSGTQREAIANAHRRSEPLLLRNLLPWQETAWSLEQWRAHEGFTILRRDPASGAWQSVRAFIDAVLADDTRVPRHTGDQLYTEGCLLPDAWEGRFAMPLLPVRCFGLAQLWFG